MQQAPQPASQSAEAALQALSESLDAERSNIGKNKLKKLRQKRSKLAKQVHGLSSQEGSQGQPPGKRPRLGTAATARLASGSEELSQHTVERSAGLRGSRTRTAQHDGLCSNNSAAPASCAVLAATAAGVAAAAAGAAVAAAAGVVHATGGVGSRQQHGSSWSATECEVSQQPPQPVVRGWGGHMDLSLMVKLISVQQQQQQQQQVHSVAACAAAGAVYSSADRMGVAAAAAAAATGATATAAAATAVECSLDMSVGPCRSDMSGELLLVSHQLGGAAVAGAGAAAVAAAVAAGGAALAIAAAPEEGAAAAPSTSGRGGEQQQQAGGGRKRKPSYIYGNYAGYYTYRRLMAGPEQAHDPRLSVLDASWFRGKDALDVGCNEGVVSLDLAALFHTRSMVGVDIDASLIHKATRNLSTVRHALSEQLRQQAAAQPSRRGGGGDGGGGPALWALQRQVKALGKISFRAANWLEGPCPVGRYEVVTCFSVSKWVHLHHGDPGLKQLFKRFYRCLVPGGILVLEPQPWSSYQNARRKQSLFGVPFWDCTELKLRPPQFVDYLTEEAGFQLVGTYHVAAEQVGSKGWDRPIHVLRKPGAAGTAGVPSGGGAAAAAKALPAQAEADAAGGRTGPEAAATAAAAAAADAPERSQQAVSGGSAGVSAGSSGGGGSKKRLSKRRQRQLEQQGAQQHFGQ